MTMSKLAALAGFALILGASPVLADSSYPSGRNQVFMPDASYSQPAPSGGADLSVFGNESFTNTFDHGRCVQAINDNEASNVRAFCPPDKWNLVQ